jgi:phage terminase large subunit
MPDNRDGTARGDSGRGLGDMGSADAGLRTLAEFVLNEAQCAFVECRERFCFYVGGIGAGKTHAGAVRAILRAARLPGSLGLVGAPTYTMLRDTSQRTFFDLLPPHLNAGFSRQEGLLRLANGSEVIFRSLDAPDRVRGLNLAWFWLDEAPLAGHYAWQVLKGRLRQRGYPTAGWATGTPRGRDGYWHDFEGQPRANHALFRASTYANIHNLPDDFLQDLGYRDNFRRQEVLGLFVAFEGLVYALDPGPHGHVCEPPEGAQWAEVVGGVDWGFTNPSAAVVFGLDGDGRAWQLDEFYERHAALETALLPALLDLTRRYRVTRWYCGPDEPEHISALSAALAAAGLGAVALKGDNAMRPGIQTITGLLARRPDGTRGLLVAPRCVHTITEYGSYQYPSAGEGAAQPRPGAAEIPLKRNDHALDATRYALHTHLSQARAASAYLDALRLRATRHRS